MREEDNHVICTLFDHRYLSRAVCMIESARRHGFTRDIWALCLTEECEQIMVALALPGVRILPLQELERQIPGLEAVKPTRSIIEYYFTCMAALHTYLFTTQPQIDGTMYVDADIKFYANPEIVFSSINDAPVAITPHNFAEKMRHLECCGVFNAGWTAFRRTPEGLKCLSWWLERSLEWCFDRVEGGRFANQGYLDQFCRIAPRTKVLTQKGYNCAPWNIGNYAVTECDGAILVDDEPLVFFHFHGLKRRLGRFQIQHREYGAPVSWLMRNKIYRPYVADLLRVERIQKTISGTNAILKAQELHRSKRGMNLSDLIRKLLRRPWKPLMHLARLIQNRPIIVVGSHVI